MIELILNSTSVDVAPGSVVALTFQVANLFDLKTINGNYSNRINVVKSAENEYKLEQAGMINSGTLIPYKKNTCKLVQDSVELIPNGFAVLEETEEFFVFTVYSGNVSLVDLIENKNIYQDIDWSDLNHYRNFNNVRGSRFNTSGYIYPIIDYGTLNNTDNDFRADMSLPAVFLHEVVSRIFAPLPLTVKGKLFDETEYKNILIPCNGIKASDGLLLAEAEISGPMNVFGTSIPDLKAVNFDNEISDPQESIIAGGAMQIRPVSFNFDTSYLSVPSSIYFSNAWTYRSLFAGNYFFEINILYSFTRFDLGFATPDHYSIKVFQGSSEIYSIESESNTSNSLLKIDISAQMGVEDICIAALAFDGSLTFHSATFKVKQVTNATSPVFGDAYDVQGNIPKLTQIDVLKTVIQLFGAIPMTNNITDVVQFVTFNEIEQNKGKSRDWTKYVDHSRKNKIKYRLDFARNNYMRYKADKLVTPELGDGIIPINDETLQLKKDLFTLPFAATDTELKMQNKLIAKIPFVKAFSGTTIQEVNEFEPRLIRMKKEDVSINYITGAPSSATHNDSIPFAYFIRNQNDENLGFGNNVIDRRHELIKRIFDKTKVVTEYIYLPETEVYNFDHSIPIYLEQHQAHFIVNKIPAFIAGESTACELIKI